MIRKQEIPPLNLSERILQRKITTRSESPLLMTTQRIITNNHKPKSINLNPQKSQKSISLYKQNQLNASVISISTIQQRSPQIIKRSYTEASHLEKQIIGLPIRQKNLEIRQITGQYTRRGQQTYTGRGKRMNTELIEKTRKWQSRLDAIISHASEINGLLCERREK